MSSPTMWNDFIPGATIEKDKENVLLEHIMNFHIHPADSYKEEPEPKSKCIETPTQQEPKFREALKSRTWRRNSEGAIFHADKNRKSNFPQDILQPSLLNRLWLQNSNMLDPDSQVGHYPPRNPAERLSNRERASTRSRPRVAVGDQKAMQRLNISPVRTESGRRHVSKIFIPPRKNNVRGTAEENSASVDESKKSDANPQFRESSDYSDLNNVSNLRTYDAWIRDSRSSRASYNVSNSQSSSDISDRNGRAASLVTISADAVLRKVKCPPEVLCEPRKIVTQNLRNCLVTYIPEDGSRFVTYVSDDLLQAKEQIKIPGKQRVAGGNNRFETKSIWDVDAPPTKPNQKAEQAKPKEIELYLNFANHIRPFHKFSKKGTVLCRRVPIRSLTSRAIPIDSPDLKPIIPTTSSQMPKTKSKYFRRKEAARQFSACPSYATSFPDSTILTQFQPDVRPRTNLKFNRIWTNHQKSYVNDPVVDFRKEVKKIMQTSQGYLRSRLVQAPGKHPKVIACHVSDGQSAPHAGIRLVEDRGRSRRIEPVVQRKFVRGKSYAVVLPNNVHPISSHESAPIYVLSSASAQMRNLHNEVDA